MLEQTYKLIVDFSIEGDLAYLSHRETLKMFQRALIRASVPLVFSQGFNPHPYLTIPLPRSVGTQSVRDRICVTVQFSQCPSVEELQASIQTRLPAECRILEVQYKDSKASFHPESVRYVFRFEPLFEKQHQEHLGCCREQMDEKRSIEIRRYWAKKKRYKQFDIAPCLKDLTYSDDHIEIMCHILPSGTVRIDELMQWLNVEPKQLLQPVCRTEINWCQN